MFKDIYKAANDDIKPNPYLMARIINKANQPTEKRESFFYRHGILVVAAVLALVIALPSFLNPEKGHKTTLDNKTSTPSVTGSSQFLLAASPSDDTIVMTVNEITPSPVNARGIGFAIDEAQPASPVEITAAEYFEGLGFSPDSLTLPESFTPDFDDSTTVTVTKNGEKTVNDENMFSYSGDGFLIITTSSSADMVNEQLNNPDYKKSSFGGKDAVVLYDGSMYHAYIIHGSGTALKISTDMPEESLKALLLSASE